MFLYEPVEMGLFWVMEEGTIAHCELFHETSMCECLCVSRKERFVLAKQKKVCS